MTGAGSEEEVEPGAPVQATARAPHFLAHREGDHVAVAVQDVAPGRRRVVYMDSDRADEVEVLEAVPLGHKLALVDRAEAAEVIEYGVRIGVTRLPVSAGQLVHVHNLRSARWPSSS